MLWFAVCAPGAAVEPLALSLARFSPRLVVVPAQGEVPAGVLLEVSACLRLFGGAPKLWRRVREAAVAATAVASASHAPTALLDPPDIRLAAAPTASGAHLLAWAQAVPLRTRDPAELRRWVAALPLPPVLALWQLPERLAGLLHGLGLRTVGEVLALPRDGLKRRGGAALLARLDCVLGAAPDPWPEWALPETFELARELPERSEQVPLMLAVLEAQLESLIGWLTARGRLAVGLQLVLRHDTTLRQSHPDTVWALRLAEPTRERSRLLRLWRERFERESLPAPVSRLTLRLTEDLPLHQHPGAEGVLAWSEAGARGPSELPAERERAARELIDRLSARLGAERVRRLRVRPDHRPERAGESVPALQPAASPTRAAGLHPRGPLNCLPNGDSPPSPDTTPPRPFWLLPEPLLLAERQGQLWHGGPLRLCSRPERIEGGWFDEGLVQRDYYVAEGRDHRLRWVYRERSSAQWFLHGWFD